MPVREADDRAFDLLQKNRDKMERLVAALMEREELLKPSRTEGNTRLYTEEDLQRLEFILSLARELGVNIAGIAIILQMRERMEAMQHQIQDFVQYVQREVLPRAAAVDPAKGALVPLRRAIVAPAPRKK